MADLTPKQGVAWRLLRDTTHTEILYGGSAGGGKTRLGCIWEMASAIEYQGSRWLMGRAVLKTLKETTLKSFFDQCSEDGIRVGRDFTFNAQTSTLHFGASEILLKDMALYPSDPNFDELGSLELTGAFGDEVNQWPEKAKDIVTSRIRYKLDQFGIGPKFLGTCNPSKGWVFNQFYSPWKTGRLEKHRAFIPALVTDNPAFNPTILEDGTVVDHPYVAALKRLKGADRERLLLGNWDYDSDPAALMDRDSIMGIFDSEEVEPGKKAITCDVARYGSDKTVIMLWSGLRVEHIFLYGNQATNITAAAILQIAKSEDVQRSRIVVDDDGVGGGVVDLIRGCTPFNANSKPLKDENYKNLKAQCCYMLAEKVNAGKVYVNSRTYQEEISAELGWIKRDKIDEDTKLTVLPKDKVKEGLGRSPDFGDNLMMRMRLELSPTMATFERSLDREAQRGREELSRQFRDELEERYGRTGYPT